MVPCCDKCGPNCVGEVIVHVAILAGPRLSSSGSLSLRHGQSPDFSGPAEDDVLDEVEEMLAGDDRRARRSFLFLWPKGSLRYLVRAGQYVWRTTGAAMSEPALRMIVEADVTGLRRAGADSAQVLQVYSDLCKIFVVEPQDLPAVRTFCEEWLKQRLMEHGLDRAQQAISAGDVDVIPDIIRRAILAPVEADNSVILTSGSDDFIQAQSASPQAATRIGLPELDHAWEGGYRPGELGMIVAPTGIGKSMVLSMMAAEAFWQGKHVMYMTYELTPDQIRSRIAGAILRKGPRFLTKTWAEELTAAADKGDLPNPLEDERVRAQGLQLGYQQRLALTWFLGSDHVENTPFKRHKLPERNQDTQLRPPFLDHATSERAV